MITAALPRTLMRRYMSEATENFIWVSIREPEDIDPNDYYGDIILPETCKGVLVLCFSDLISNDWSEDAIARMEKEYSPKWLPFTYAMKAELDSFIQQSNVNRCVVNCFAGVSRSAALAAYVGRHTYEPDWFEKYYKTSGKFPCFYVCRMLGLPIPEFSK